MSTMTTHAELIELPVNPPVRSVQADPVDLPPTVIPVQANRVLAHDPRVDVVAMFKQVKPVVEAIEKELKEEMKAGGAASAYGEVGEATLTVSKAPDVIDPVEFYKLCTKRGLTMDDVKACLTVSKERATELLSKRDVATLVQPGKPPEPRLTVKIPKGEFVPSTAAALQYIGEHLPDKWAGKQPHGPAGLGMTPAAGE